MIHARFICVTPANSSYLLAWRKCSTRVVSKMSKRRLNFAAIFAAEKNSVLARLFDTIDANRDSEISWQEFLSFQAKAKVALKATWPFDLSSIRKEFSDMDTDGSGSISKTEFVQVFTNLYDSTALGELETILDVMEKSPSPDIKKDDFVRQMMQEFDQADIDGDGSIDFSEYVRNVWDKQNEATSTTLRQLRRQFKAYDLNHDGRISRDEFKILAENVYYESMKEI